MRYDELEGRLLPEARELFGQIVNAHLEAASGDRLFILSQGLGGPTRLVGPGRGSKNITGFDPGTLDDLAGYGLLRVGIGGRGSRNYRVTSEGVHFYHWLMQRAGLPIDQTEATVRQLVDGSAFAAAHPGCSHHLNEAFALLWSDRTDDQTISELGDHLRKALFDLATDLSGDGEGDRERPIARLRSLIARGDRAGAREQRVLEHLVELADVVLRLDHRLAHIRDEMDKGEPLRGWEEARRACFVTAVACYELHRLFSS